MKITIKEEEEVLELSTESLDNYNFVDLYAYRMDEEKHKISAIEMTVGIDELYTAVKAFKEHADRAFDKERKYER